MSVWTLIVERDRHHETNFTKPWEPQKGFEAHVMYGPPDSRAAWNQAREFMVKSLNLREPQYRVVALMKGNFGTNFYSFLEEENE